MPKPIHILNGPNLNLLGTREPDIYGHETLEHIRMRCERTAVAAGYEIEFRQTNHEGVLIDWVHKARTDAAAIVINPAGYGHTSIALLDALKAVDVPIVECHLSNPATREPFRSVSYVSPVAAGVVSGFGPDSYDFAVEAACRLAAAHA